MSTFGYLPTITMANDNNVSSHGVGTIHLLASLSINNVLYVPMSPFNLLFINRLTRSLIVLFILPKMLFVYRTKIRDG